MVLKGKHFQAKLDFNSGVALWMTLLSMLSLLLSGCEHFLPKDAQHRGVGEASAQSVDWYNTSEVHRDLMSLPTPTGKMTISVYNFRDQTGQYLPQPANAFSTAVPQGTLPMLMSALRASEWFELVEREGLQNLLTERKILRARKDERGDKRPIKALSASNVIIEGGILAYDTNIRTGGGGAKYVGIGSSGQYREDQVTIGLRAVDVNSGRIFNSVSVTKKLLSTQLMGNVFRYIRFKKLLEVEGGVTETDPAQVVVMDAIEEAVIRLVVSGIVSNHWGLKYDIDENHPLMEKYSDPIQYAQWKQNKYQQRDKAREGGGQVPSSSVAKTKSPANAAAQASNQAKTQTQTQTQTSIQQQAKPSTQSPANKSVQQEGKSPRQTAGKVASGVQKAVNGVISGAQSVPHDKKISKNAVKQAIKAYKPLTSSTNAKSSPPKGNMTKSSSNANSQTLTANKGSKLTPNGKPNSKAQVSKAHASSSSKTTKRSSEKITFSVAQSASLNNKMKQTIIKKKSEKKYQSMTKNRPRSENAPVPKNYGPYTIQLYAGPTDAALLTFLDEYPSMSGEVWQDRHNYLGKVWYTVVYGRYPNSGKAKEVLQALPLHIKDLSPWIRTVGMVKE